MKKYVLFFSPKFSDTLLDDYNIDEHKNIFYHPNFLEDIEDIVILGYRKFTHKKGISPISLITYTKNNVCYDGAILCCCLEQALVYKTVGRRTYLINRISVLSKRKNQESVKNVLNTLSSELKK